MAYDWLGASILPSSITYGLAFIALLIGSITDLKTREVPDWVNYGLICSGVALNLLFSIIYSNPSFILSSIIGLAIFFVIAYVMFYAGQWGGGDSKMLMGIGAIIGIKPSFSQQFLAGFFINALLVGAAYGLLWSMMLAVKNKRKFIKELRKELSKKAIVNIKKFLIAGIVLIVVLSWLLRGNPLSLVLLMLAFLALCSFYLFALVRAVEKSSMYKLVEPSKLTEGDWIVKNVVVDKKYVTGPKDLGISKSQIRKLVELHRKGKVKKILIKEGIPFVPSFLIAFIITFLFGNVLILLIQ